MKEKGGKRREGGRKEGEEKRKLTSTSTPGSREMEVCEKTKMASRLAAVGREEGETVGRVGRRGTYDLLNDLGRGVQVNEPLVDLHLESVPGLGSLSTRTAYRKKGTSGKRRVSSMR